MTFKAALLAFKRSTRRRANAARTAILALQKRLTLLEDLIGKGAPLNRALYSQMEIVHVRVTAIVGSAVDGICTVVPLEYDGTDWVDDTEDATAFNVMCGPGAIPFVGCRCRVMLVAVIAGVGKWITVGGECDGFRAKLTGTVDGSYTYPWTQVDNAPGTSALTHATGSLGRCLDKASAAYDSNITSRVAIPTNTEVTLHWNYTSGKFEFVFSPEPQSEEC